jgi:ankyrin repeat protein
MFPHPHDALPLPPRPDLDQYKKRAKDLLKASQSQDPTALHTWASTWIASLIRLSDIGREGKQPKRSQPNNSVLPSEVGASRSEAAKQSRARPELAEGDLLLFANRRTALLENFARQHLSESPTLTAAQFVLARAHGFDSWPKLAKHLEAIARANSLVNHFEQATDAIITGDKTTLAHLLKKYPDLVRAHSTRRHQATLLHYTAANGIEDYRQKTPANIVEITHLLLTSGADVNAVADLYGGSTTLSLLATSVHPERAGLQMHLLKLLFDHGATIDAAVAPDYTRGLLINTCLANGRRLAAEFLADRGAKLDLEAAAGLGRLDLVKTLFTSTANSNTKATDQQKEKREQEAENQPKGKDEEEEKQPEKESLKKQRALVWACEYGHDPVVNFLLDQGVPIQSQANTGQTPLHWAVIGRQKFTIALLLSRGADLEAKNAYGGTPLGQARWSAAHTDYPAAYLEIAALLTRHGAKSE